jgi:hypothetical protein
MYHRPLYILGSEVWSVMFCWTALATDGKNTAAIKRHAVIVVGSIPLSDFTFVT